MIHDAACPDAFVPAAASVERKGLFYTAAQWSPEGVRALADHLDTAGRRALAALPPRRRLDAWCEAVARFRDPEGGESAAVRTALARFSGLSPPALEGALEAVLGGVDRGAAARLFATAQTAARGDSSPAGGLVAVFLSSNLPALAVQSLLPALALGRPILLKSPTAEPLFAPAFVRVLCQIEPELGPALAALTWKGGDLALETPILEMAPTVLVYGEQDTVDSVAARAAGTCVTYGPKASLALIGKAVEPAAVAAGLARDIALFDQRGCLSIQAIYTAGDARALAKELGAALAAIEEQWPAGELDPVAASRVQQWRADARLRGLFLCDLPLASGTVIVDPLPDFTPSPGLRTVRICPLALERAIDHLDPWRGRIQGTALAGDDAWGLESRLVDIGVSRCAAPGQLQVPDALWHNGGAHPLEVLGARVPAD